MGNEFMNAEIDDTIRLNRMLSEHPEWWDYDESMNYVPADGAPDEIREFLESKNEFQRNWSVRK